MFDKMTGRQLAGWGYGLFWMGLLVETINAIIGANSPAATNVSTYCIGFLFSAAFVVPGIRMLTLIRHRPW